MCPSRQLGDKVIDGCPNGVPLKATKGVGQINIDDRSGLGGGTQVRFESSAEMHKPLSTTWDANAKLATEQTQLLDPSPRALNQPLRDYPAPGFANTNWPWRRGILLLDENNARIEKPARCRN